MFSQSYKPARNLDEYAQIISHDVQEGPVDVWVRASQLPPSMRGGDGAAASGWRQRYGVLDIRKGALEVYVSRECADYRAYTVGSGSAGSAAGGSSGGVGSFGRPSSFLGGSATPAAAPPSIYGVLVDSIPLASIGSVSTMRSTPAPAAQQPQQPGMGAAVSVARLSGAGAPSPVGVSYEFVIRYHKPDEGAAAAEFDIGGVSSGHVGAANNTTRGGVRHRDTRVSRVTLGSGGGSSGSLSSGGGGGGGGGGGDDDSDAGSAPSVGPAAGGARARTTPRLLAASASPAAEEYAAALATPRPSASARRSYSELAGLDGARADLSGLLTRSDSGEFVTTTTAAAAAAAGGDSSDDDGAARGSDADDVTAGSSGGDVDDVGGSGGYAVLRMRCRNREEHNSWKFGLQRVTVFLSTQQMLRAQQAVAAATAAAAAAGGSGGADGLGSFFGGGSAPFSAASSGGSSSSTAAAVSMRATIATAGGGSSLLHGLLLPALPSGDSPGTSGSASAAGSAFPSPGGPPGAGAAGTSTGGLRAVLAGATGVRRDVSSGAFSAAATGGLDSRGSSSLATTDTSVSSSSSGGAGGRDAFPLTAFPARSAGGFGGGAAGAAFSGGSSAVCGISGYSSSMPTGPGLSLLMAQARRRPPPPALSAAGGGSGGLPGADVPLNRAPPLSQRPGAPHVPRFGIDTGGASAGGIGAVLARGTAPSETGDGSRRESPLSAASNELAAASLGGGGGGVSSSAASLAFMRPPALSAVLEEDGMTGSGSSLPGSGQTSPADGGEGGERAAAAGFQAPRQPLSAAAAAPRGSPPSSSSGATSSTSGHTPSASGGSTLSATDSNSNSSNNNVQQHHSATVVGRKRASPQHLPVAGQPSGHLPQLHPHPHPHRGRSASESSDDGPGDHAGGEQHRPHYHHVSRHGGSGGGAHPPPSHAHLRHEASDGSSSVHSSSDGEDGDGLRRSRSARSAGAHSDKRSRIDSDDGESSSYGGQQALDASRGRNDSLDGVPFSFGGLDMETDDPLLALGGGGGSSAVHGARGVKKAGGRSGAAAAKTRSRRASSDAVSGPEALLPHLRPASSVASSLSSTASASAIQAFADGVAIPGGSLSTAGPGAGGSASLRVVGGRAAHLSTSLPRSRPQPSSMAAAAAALELQHGGGIGGGGSERRSPSLQAAPGSGATVSFLSPGSSFQPPHQQQHQHAAVVAVAASAAAAASDVAPAPAAAAAAAASGGSGGAWVPRWKREQMEREAAAAAAAGGTGATTSVAGAGLAAVSVVASGSSSSSSTTTASVAAAKPAPRAAAPAAVPTAASRPAWDYGGVNQGAGSCGWGVWERQGARRAMEDACLLLDRLEEVTEGGAVAVGAAAATSTAFFAVFDGHGGRFAADFAAARLHGYIAGHDAFAADLPSAVTAAFLRCDAEFCAGHDAAKEAAVAAAVAAAATAARPPPNPASVLCPPEWLSGTTALLALVRGHTLVTASLGDSRAVLVRADGSHEQVSVEHSPESERSRIEGAGGWVLCESHISIGRVMHDTDFSDPAVGEIMRNRGARWVEVSRVCSDLAVSRAIGDCDFKGPHRMAAYPWHWGTPGRPDWHGPPRAFSGDLVLATPDVRSYRLADGVDALLVLACDGLWEVLTSAEAATLVRWLLAPRPVGQGLSPKHAARRLAELALKLGTSDNVTVAVVVLPTAPAHLREAVRVAEEEDRRTAAAAAAAASGHVGNGSNSGGAAH
jgi:serine/threonine protein phosphatase PrpC